MTTIMLIAVSFLCFADNRFGIGLNHDLVKALRSIYNTVLEIIKDQVVIVKFSIKISEQAIKYYANAVTRKLRAMPGSLRRRFMPRMP